MQKDITEVVKELSEPVVNQQNMFLVDVELMHKKIPEVWVLVDAEEGGVNVDSCSVVSREVANLLEEQNIFGGAYRLNVSSPGLSRPLSDKRQYRKNIGRTAKVKYKIENSYHTTEGVIEAVENELITILDEKNEKVELEFSQIVETKIIPKI